MDERYQPEPEDAADGERADIFAPLDDAGDDPRLDDEIGIPATQATGGLAGDAESLDT
jgi:hypothetical protein